MLFSKSVVLALASLAAAHPGHEEEEHAKALAARDQFIAGKRALQACAEKLEALNNRGIERRKATLAKERIARRIPVEDAYYLETAKRATIPVLLKDHEGTINATTALDSPDTYVFNATASTILNAEGEVGPFYVLGEYVRSDIRNDEEGVDVILEAQVVDVATCEPLSGAYLDIWSANSTGVYSGVQTNLNGNGADASNLNNTALRGLQVTDDDGVVKFTTKFPGHYSGRCTHLHVVIHEGAEELANGTIAGGTVSHIGQLFWDQKLVDEVEATLPYSTNTQRVTLNRQDRVFVTQETEFTDSDPVFNYVFVGDDISEGIFSWIYIGVNTTATYTPTYSFELTAGGGEAVAGGGGFPGGPGGPGGGPPA
ncbi:Intradiol ring-cleavage dioxygenase [Xylariales sp. PMI_506]|nr:Intradiol ring-cleavage dioxygenase [Xylariales sp. PMI_506]